MTVRHCIRWTSVLAILGVLVAGPPARADALINEKILRNFDIVAFGNEYTHKRYDAVRKWVAPIRIGIQGKNYPR